MKFLLIIFILTGCSQLSSAYAADPCREDPACYKTANAHFDHPNHYIFIGASPGDELLLYPLMKDHCAEATSYCAMIIATRGKSDCESGSGEMCAETRAAALQLSAEYLNADLWHYDLPGSQAIQPATFMQVRDTYTRLARNSGFNEISDYFRYFFRQLQFSEEKPLVILSLQPYYGSIDQGEDIVTQVIDEAITRAVEALQHEGMHIAHFYADSRKRGAGAHTFIGRQNDTFLDCRKGNAPLLATHTDLTNYEVFAYGYHDIYQSHAGHTSELNPDPEVHEFCLDSTINYFNTAHADKIFGLLLTESDQLNEISNFSNAFAFVAMQPSDITGYLDKNSDRLLPLIDISQFFFDKTRHVFNYADVSPVVQAIRASSYQGPVLFLIDEPLWHIRAACLKKIETACKEIRTGYAHTLAVFRRIGRDLRKILPESGMIHIEAYLELLLQKLDHPARPIVLLDSAEYLGFNCYGPFDDCGVRSTADLPAGIQPQSQLIFIDWIRESLDSLETTHAIGRKILLIPGAFQDFNAFPAEPMAVEQFETFARVLNRVYFEMRSFSSAGSSWSLTQRRSATWQGCALIRCRNCSTRVTSSSAVA